MHRFVFNEIIDHIFGRKYYANIFNTRGTSVCSISSDFFRTKKEAEEHRKRIESSASFVFIETITFRSHTQF